MFFLEKYNGEGPGAALSLYTIACNECTCATVRGKVYRVCVKSHRRLKIKQNDCIGSYKI